MMRRTLVISMLVTSLLGIACSRKVELAGDVVATSPYGEAKRLDGVEVMIVRGRDQFEQELKEQAEQYRTQGAYAMSFYRDKLAAAERGKQAGDEAHQAAAQSGRFVGIK